jgi:(p)ppGpp synthase/HD superfamily hydrolase
LIDKFIAAFTYAHEAHLGQTRKGTTIPYLVHPLDVANVLSNISAPAHVVIAGLLHDVIEDGGKSLSEVKELFGEDIAALVDGATEPEKLRKRDGKTSWKQRKTHTIERIREASYELKLLSLADKLSNLRDMVNEYNETGDTFWSKFNAPKQEQAWYYRSMLESYSNNNEITKTAAYAEFKNKVEYLFE